MYNIYCKHEVIIMKNNVLEANVVMARCGKTGQAFGIRVEKRTDNNWYCTWAFPMSESAASKEGYSSKVSGTILFDDEYPGCPHCQNSGWVLCGCGKLTCWTATEKTVTCKWCGKQSEVEVKSNFDLQGGGY